MGLTLRPSWEPSPSGESVVVLAGRATRVPQAAVTSGMQRSVTVNSRRPMGWAHIPDLGWGRRPKLHGMQGVQGLRSAQLDHYSATVAPAQLSVASARGHQLSMYSKAYETGI